MDATPAAVTPISAANPAVLTFHPRDPSARAPLPMRVESLRGVASILKMFATVSCGPLLEFNRVARGAPVGNRAPRADARPPFIVGLHVREGDPRSAGRVHRRLKDLGVPHIAYRAAGGGYVMLADLLANSFNALRTAGEDLAGRATGLGEFAPFVDGLGAEGVTEAALPLPAYGRRVMVHVDGT